MAQGLPVYPDYKKKNPVKGETMKDYGKGAMMKLSESALHLSVFAGHRLLWAPASINYD